jgi:asparagine synthase (glutamine-hydrolysing)
MVDPQLGLTVAFNGCIYNYPELRVELEGMGLQFFSSGDTEVILKAWHAWGLNCVDRFAGMFAFAIHERDTGRVILGRDRFGIKPLYLAESPKKLRFRLHPARSSGRGAMSTPRSTPPRSTTT